MKKVWTVLFCVCMLLAAFPPLAVNADVVDTGEVVGIAITGVAIVAVLIVMAITAVLIWYFFVKKRKS